MQDADGCSFEEVGGTLELSSLASEGGDSRKDGLHDRTGYSI